MNSIIEIEQSLVTWKQSSSLMFASEDKKKI